MTPQLFQTVGICVSAKLPGEQVSPRAARASRPRGARQVGGNRPPSAFPPRRAPPGDAGSTPTQAACRGPGPIWARTAWNRQLPQLRQPSLGQRRSHQPLRPGRSPPLGSGPARPGLRGPLPPPPASPLPSGHCSPARPGALGLQAAWRRLPACPRLPRRLQPQPRLLAARDVELRARRGGTEA